MLLTAILLFSALVVICWAIEIVLDRLEEISEANDVDKRKERDAW